VSSWAVRERLLQPLVVAARRDAEDATHCLHAVPVSMGFNEFVRRADSPRAWLRGHRLRPPRLPDAKRLSTESWELHRGLWNRPAGDSRHFSECKAIGCNHTAGVRDGCELRHANGIPGRV
jgi:hypothetical protein